MLVLKCRLTTNYVGENYAYEIKFKLSVMSSIENELKFYNVL